VPRKPLLPLLLEDARLKFKTKPGRDPELEYKDDCGDVLHSFLPPTNSPYAMILWTEGRVGLTRKKAVKFAENILKEFGEF
jgi:hypothetical protein